MQRPSPWLFAIWRKMLRPYEAGLARLTPTLALAFLAVWYGGIVSLNKEDFIYGIFMSFAFPIWAAVVASALAEIFARSGRSDIPTRVGIASVRLVTVLGLLLSGTAMIGSVHGNWQFLSSNVHLERKQFLKCIDDALSDMQEAYAHFDKAVGEWQHCANLMNSDLFHLELATAKKEVSRGDAKRMRERLKARCEQYKEYADERSAVLKSTFSRKCTPPKGLELPG